MPDLTPVTILCGFLGAGKTTLLRHLLSQNEGARWALVVNDVGAINLDARLISDLVAGKSVAGEAEAALQGASEVVDLGNGCVCCSNKDDLAETLCRLASAGRFDHIIVETTGLAEPAALARLFVQRNEFGRSVTDFARLHGLFTVIDAPDLLQRLASRDRSPTSPGAVKPLVELLLEQAECADVLLLNKCDRCPEEELLRLEALLADLNPHAELLRTEFSQAPVEWVLGRARFSAATTLGAARWISDLNAAAPVLPGAPARRPTVARSVPEYTRRYGLRSFLFRARKPFARERLMELLERGLPGIVRAKGFYWLAERPDEMAFLSLAGGACSHTWLNYWWAAMVEAGKVSLDDRPPLIRALWEEPAGDRRQELVLIGVDFDEAALRRALEACLVDS
jgi:G3E family GTPase